MTFAGHNNTVYSVMGLHPFSVYSFKVVAVNGVGLSKESEQSYYMITLREVGTFFYFYIKFKVKMNMNKL